ncbi:hypothetical protein IFM89_021115 [Coptis chinensis]|uniref:DUF4283 domain-containing protein n=1 Tax=Coptis chinensis TaxID=261450 RepID=A0A835HLE4_9MAGN|nr:hypothetical protein IFM89_021115 [Coptis chinensis]
MELGPIYMAGNYFIVTPWSQDVEKRRKTIKGIPIWVNLYDVPKELWSDEGLGVVASRLGKPLLMDEATASKKRISFARACIEVEISSELPLSFEIEMEKGDNRTTSASEFQVLQSLQHTMSGVQEGTNEGVINTATLKVNQITTVVAGVEESNGIANNGPTDGDVCNNKIMIQGQNQAQPDMEPAADNDDRILHNLSVVPYVDSVEHFVNSDDIVAMAEFEEELVDFIRRTEGIGDGEMSEDVLSVEETPYFSDKVTEPLAIMDTPIQHKKGMCPLEACMHKIPVDASAGILVARTMVCKGRKGALLAEEFPGGDGPQ